MGKSCLSAGGLRVFGPGFGVWEVWKCAVWCVLGRWQDGGKRGRPVRVRCMALRHDAIMEDRRYVGPGSEDLRGLSLEHVNDGCFPLEE